MHSHFWGSTGALKAVVLVLLHFMALHTTHAQTHHLTTSLTVTRVAEGTYVHSADNNNGLVYINGGQAVVVSTPASDVETQRLIDWLVNDRRVQIVAYVVDRWHPDAMEGLDVVLHNGIPTYAHMRTQGIAQKKNLPVAAVGFDAKLEIGVGEERIVCHYLGAAHTTDGIVAWLPAERVLFGGNGVRNDGGWVGNIGDADLSAWSATIEAVRDHYGGARVVIPGHGRHGGSELLDYTIDLYRNQANATAGPGERLTTRLSADFTVQSGQVNKEDGTTVVRHGEIFVRDSEKIVRVTANEIRCDPEEGRWTSPAGRVTIYDRVGAFGTVRTDVYYEELYLIKIDDAVGLRVVIKSWGEPNRSGRPWNER